MKEEIFAICKKCDARNMPHAPFIDCKDNEINWLRLQLREANKKIEFYKEIVGIRCK